jgi:hypothetical protein
MRAATVGQSQIIPVARPAEQQLLVFDRRRRVRPVRLRGTEKKAFWTLSITRL